MLINWSIKSLSKIWTDPYSIVIINIIIIIYDYRSQSTHTQFYSLIGNESVEYENVPWHGTFIHSHLTELSLMVVKLK